MLQKHNITLLNHPYDKFYYESHVLNELEYYLKEIKYNKNILKEISGSILPKFIEDDNKRLKSLFRKIFIIKKRQQQKILMHYFHKWIINMYNFKENDNKSKSKEKSIKIRNKQENKSKSNSLIKNDKTNNNNYSLQERKMGKAINLKLASTTKNKIKKFHSFLDKNTKNKNLKTNSLISKKTSPNITYNSQLSPIQTKIKKINQKTNQNNIKIKAEIENIKNNSCSFPKQAFRMLSEMNNTRNKIKKVKTPNKNKSIVKNFINNLITNKRLKEEKMRMLNLTKEEKFKSIYTFSPKLLNNKKNEKYFNNMIDRFYVNKTNDLSNNNNTINEENIFDDNFDTNNLNNYKLDLVIEENKKNKKLNFFSRLNEYAKRRKINLEKIKNDILMDECINDNKDKNNITNYKYNIINDHLLNASNSYYDNKKRTIEKLIKEIDEEKGITFEPKLNNQYNNRIKNNINNLKEILLNKKNEKIFDYLSNKDKECTFHPKINEINKINLINGKNNNVSERLLSYLDKYNQQLNELKNQKPKYSFKPKISKNTYTILNNRKINNNNLKEELKINFSSGDLNQKYKEEKYSLKMGERQKKFENNKENNFFTPDFEYSPKENLQKIDYNEFNNDKINENNNFEEEENYFNKKYRNYLINNGNKRNKKYSNNNSNNKNLMSFDYYENLI